MEYNNPPQDDLPSVNVVMWAVLHSVLRAVEHLVWASLHSHSVVAGTGGELMVTSTLTSSLKESTKQ